MRGARRGGGSRSCRDDRVRPGARLAGGSLKRTRDVRSQATHFTGPGFGGPAFFGRTTLRRSVLLASLENRARKTTAVSVDCIADRCIRVAQFVAARFFGRIGGFQEASLDPAR